MACPRRGIARANLFLALAQILLASLTSGALFPQSYSSPTFARDCVGRETEKLFVLTFDDGPWEQTRYILDILAEKQAPATFFVIGSNFDRFPALKSEYEMIVNRILKEGHIVGNHGMTNDLFTVNEVKECHSEIARVANNYTMKYFRPAMGAYTFEKYEQLIFLMKYFFVMWNLDLWDWKADSDPAAILDFVRYSVENPTSPPTAEFFEANGNSPRRGSFIMLAHDNHDTMIQEVDAGMSLLGAIIDTVRDAGYRIVSLDECLGLAPSAYDLGTKFCGRSWAEAASCKIESCPSGTGAECPDGMYCYADIQCPGKGGTSGGSRGHWWWHSWGATVCSSLLLAFLVLL